MNEGRACTAGGVGYPPWFICPFVHLSLFPFFHLSICPLVHLLRYRSLGVSRALGGVTGLATE